MLEKTNDQPNLFLSIGFVSQQNRLEQIRRDCAHLYPKKGQAVNAYQAHVWLFNIETSIDYGMKPCSLDTKPLFPILHRRA